jgi:hypothetical protein
VGSPCRPCAAVISHRTDDPSFSSTATVERGTVKRRLVLQIVPAGSRRGAPIAVPFGIEMADAWRDLRASAREPLAQIEDFDTASRGKLAQARRVASGCRRLRRTRTSRRPPRAGHDPGSPPTAPRLASIRRPATVATDTARVSRSNNREWTSRKSLSAAVTAAPAPGGRRRRHRPRRPRSRRPDTGARRRRRNGR